MKSIRFEISKKSITLPSPSSIGLMSLPEENTSMHGAFMSSHVHFILGTEGKNKMEDIVRDFKKYSSVQICRAIESNPVESRREWLLWMFKRAAAKTNKHQKYCFWQNEYHPIELSDNYIMDQKLEYIHMNPVVAGFVEES